MRLKLCKGCYHLYAEDMEACPICGDRGYRPVFLALYGKEVKREGN